MIKVVSAEPIANSDKHLATVEVVYKSAKRKGTVVVDLFDYDFTVKQLKSAHYNYRREIEFLEKAAWDANAD